MSFVFYAKAKKELAGPIRAVSGIKPSSVGIKLKQKDHVYTCRANYSIGNVKLVRPYRGTILMGIKITYLGSPTKGRALSVFGSYLNSKRI